MMRAAVVLGSIGFAIWGAPLPADALEQKYQDLSVSVEVAPVFSFSLDQPALAFGLVEPSTTKVLGDGHSSQEVKCRSNAGRPWYVKAQLVSLKNLEAGYTLPPAQLKWRIVQSTGEVKAGEFPVDFQPFATEPVLIYTSRGDDYRGKEVILHLQYSLTTPADVPAGTYVGQIVFTMAETP